MIDKVLVFDMDGTIADFYGVNGWLDMLENEDVTPYAIAKPLYDMIMLNNILNELKADGYRIIITSWLSKGGSRKYNQEVARVKKEWLDRYDFPYDEINIVKYGKRKDNYSKKYNCYQILIDDNAEVRNGWRLGGTIDASRDIISDLLALL